MVSAFFFINILWEVMVSLGMFYLENIFLGTESM